MYTYAHAHNFYYTYIHALVIFTNKNKRLKNDIKWYNRGSDETKNQSEENIDFTKKQFMTYNNKTM